MSELHLNDEEIAAVVQRAFEISSLEERLGDEPHTLDDYLKVGEEMGVPREAMRRALNERFDFLNQQIEPGLIVFARSADGRGYPAKVLASEGGSVQVRFLNGAEARVGRQDLQEANFAPGTTYEFDSPSMGMYTRSRVTQYDPEAQTVTFNNWGTVETVPLAKVRTARARKESKRAPFVWGYAVVAALGGTLGAVVTWLVLR